MTQQLRNPEAGLRNHRVEYIREDAVGSTPEDPDILKYSDTITDVTWSSDAIAEERRGIGTADPTTFIRGPESHEVSVSYDLVKWFVDGSGEANDAAYDGMFRDGDNLLPASHSFLDREDKGEVYPESTVSGNIRRSIRIYTVGRGGLVDEVSIVGDPSDQQPVSVELSYMFQKVRTYQIDQPTDDEGSTLLAFDSTNADDTGRTITVEGEDDTGTYATEEVSLDGTTMVSSTTLFQSIDAAYLDDEAQGDVTVYINEGDDTSPTAGDPLMHIYGQETYDTIEGDIGVPGVGSAGSREDTSSFDLKTFLGDTIQRGGEPVPHEMQSMTITVSNNVETTERTDAFGMAVFPGERNLTAEATMYGENATHDYLIQHLQTKSQDIVWNMEDGDVTIEGAVLTDPGDRAAESGQAVMTLDNTFTGTGIDVTNA